MATTPVDDRVGRTEKADCVFGHNLNVKPFSLVIGLIAALVLSACASPLSTPPGSATHVKFPNEVTAKGAEVCSFVHEVDRLDVVRRTLNPARFSFPDVVNARPSTARLVARAFCSLPVPNVGRSTAITCDAAYGPTYALEFSAPHVRIKPAFLDPTGCWYQLYGYPAPAQSNALWRALGTAVGIRSATWGTFTGSPVAQREPPCFTNGVYNGQGC